jgi:hypothetical protein
MCSAGYLAPHHACAHIPRVERGKHENIGIRVGQDLDCFEYRSDGDPREATALGFDHEFFVPEPITVAFDYRNQIAVNVARTCNRSANTVSDGFDMRAPSWCVNVQGEGHGDNLCVSAVSLLYRRAR